VRVVLICLKVGLMLIASILWIILMSDFRSLRQSLEHKEVDMMSEKMKSCSY
jgi:hypothetical protein